MPDQALGRGAGARRHGEAVRKQGAHTKDRDMGAVRVLGLAIVISVLVMVGSLLAAAHPDSEAPFVDGPIGTAVRQAPDPSRPVDGQGGP